MSAFPTRLLCNDNEQKSDRCPPGACLRNKLVAFFAILLASLIPINAAHADAMQHLSEYMFYSAIGDDLATGIDSYNAYHKQRQEWDKTIANLEIRLKNCDNCPDRARIQEELQYWTSTKRARDDIAWSVLDFFGQGDTKWRNGWRVVLGLVTPSEFYKDTVPHSLVVSRMRAQGVTKKCIDYYEEFIQCGRTYYGTDNPDTGQGSGCYDLYQLHALCKSGDVTGLQQAEAIRLARMKGIAIPDLVKLYSHVVFEYYGVPIEFRAPVPTPAIIDDFFKEKNEVYCNIDAAPGRVSHRFSFQWN